MLTDDDTRRYVYSVRLSDAERRKMDRWAEEWGVSDAVALRRILREYPEPPKELK